MMRPDHQQPASNTAAVNPWPGGPPSPARNFDVSGTVRDRIAAVLRERILGGELARGTRLDLDDLAREFRTSRTPVREALLALDHEGLTHITPRSKATVVGVTPQDVRDNFTVMAVLCGMAASWAAERMDEDDLARIRELGAQLADASGAELTRLNWLFHREINRASRSTPLLNQLRNTGRLVPQTFFRVIPEQVACSRVEHEELVAALVARDAERSREVTERHFLNAGALLSARLEQQGETGTAPDS
jgi:DNA-binding GntR family transcriptional regulator